MQSLREKRKKIFREIVVFNIGVKLSRFMESDVPRLFKRNCPAHAQFGPAPFYFQRGLF